MKCTHKTPLVSVIMPVYNAGIYLRAALDSVIKQTYTNIEIIVVDDASTDNSAKIIKEYAKKNKRIHAIYMTQNQNKGGDACANIALAHAHGTYIARMDADDIMHTFRIAKQVAFLENQKGHVLVGSDAHVINAEGDIVGEKNEPHTSKNIYRNYFTFHPLIHPSCLYRRIWGNEPFKYNIKYSANNDYYTFFMKICEGYKYANIPEKLLYYRIHGKNDTFVHIRQKFSNTLRIRIKMVMFYGYRPQPEQIATTILQSAIIVLLPEKTIKLLYFLAKGITKLNSPITVILNSFQDLSSRKMLKQVRHDHKLYAK